MPVDKGLNPFVYKPSEDELQGVRDMIASGDSPEHNDDIGYVTYYNRPLTDQAVDKLIQRRAHLQSEQALLKAQMEAMLAQVQARINLWDRVNAAPLEAYILARQQATGQATAILPHGTLKVTAVSASPTVSAPDELIEFLEDNPISCYADMAKAIVVRKSIPAKAVIDYVKATGEELPGVSLREARHSATISLPGAGKDGKSLSIKVDPRAIVRSVEEDSE